MALADIASFDKQNPVSLRDISLRQNISLVYLEQIFSKLKKNNRKAISLHIINYQYLGLLTEITIDNKSNKNIKFLIFSNILDKVLSSKKLLFNKEWAFVFPIK